MLAGGLYDIGKRVLDIASLRYPLAVAAQCLNPTLIGVALGVETYLRHPTVPSQKAMLLKLPLS
jgi:hypothetical protein